MAYLDDCERIWMCSLATIGAVLVLAFAAAALLILAGCAGSIETTRDADGSTSTRAEWRAGDAAPSGAGDAAEPPARDGGDGSASSSTVSGTWIDRSFADQRAALELIGDHLPGPVRNLLVGVLRALGARRGIVDHDGDGEPDDPTVRRAHAALEEVPDE